MKKNKIIIIALSMVMIGIGIFIACQKEVEDIANNSEKIEKFQKMSWKCCIRYQTCHMQFVYTSWYHFT